MKKSIFLIAIAFLLTLVVIQMAYNHYQLESEMQEQLHQIQIDFDTTKPVESNRLRITFIMGDDQKSDNPYYAKALAYYQNHQDDKTDLVINSCSTLKQVRDFLEIHRPDNGLPWGKINIVVHSNEWLGLSCSVEKGGHRADKETLLLAIENETLKPLSDEIIDGETIIKMESCALGKDQEMLEILMYAFGGFDDSELPCVRASEHFVTFNSRIENGQIKYERKLTKPWYAFHRNQEKPKAGKLTQLFSERYPEESINWSAALEKQYVSSSEAYSQQFVVPIVWDVVYPTKSSRPSLATHQDQMNWLNEQEDLLYKIEDIGIDQDLFQWKVEKVIHYYDDGTWEPAVKATGLCNVVCVLKQIS
ncbi:MAG: hypothetical protein MRY83_09450 [Flavobacteriales bacterium]|nr:hypothetical protein [Flavobacteriales bacterium]